MLLRKIHGLCSVEPVFREAGLSSEMWDLVLEQDHVCGVSHQDRL